MTPQTAGSSPGLSTCSIVFPGLCSREAPSEFLPGAELSSPQLSLAAPSASSPLLGQGSANQNDPLGCREGKSQEQPKPVPPCPLCPARKGMSQINTP